MATKKKTNEILALSCDVEINAAQAESESGESLPTFKMVAYTGGTMNVSAMFDPVVISLDGLKIKSQKTQVPYQHSRTEFIGHTTSVAIANGKLVAEGVVSHETELAAEIVSSGKNGFPWEASVGVQPIDLEFVEKDAKVTVNGRKFVGPLHVASKSVLHEISFVGRGADGNTSAKIAAQENNEGVVGMPGTQTTQEAKAPVATPTTEPSAKVTEPVATVTASAPLTDIDTMVAEARAETARKDAITANVAELLAKRPEMADEVEKLANAAIEANWDAQKFKLEAMRMTTAHPGVGTQRGDSRANNGHAIEAALCMAGGLDDGKLVDAYGEQTLDAAHKQYRNGLGLCETLLIFAQANGYRGHGTSDVRGLLQAAFTPDIHAAGISTLSLPGIFSNVANKFLRKGFDSVESAWREIAAIRPVRDFKQITSHSLTGGFEYEELAPGGELTHATVGEETYTNQARTYGRMFGIDRRDIINDDLDALTGVPTRLGRGGHIKLNKVFWKVFLDNLAFFTAGNGNFAAGAGTALGIDSLTQAEALFLDQIDPDGNPISILPTILLVPNALNAKASQLMNSTEIRNPLAPETLAISNPHAGKFKTVRSSYLSSAAIAGSSTKAWYVLADPSDMPVIEVAFLNGQQIPIVESADADFNMLGIQMRGFHDFGVNLQEFRGGAKMKGEV